jgi:hypothetical protein
MSKYTTDAKVYDLTKLPDDINEKVMEWVIDNEYSRDTFVKWDFRNIKPIDTNDQMTIDYWNHQVSTHTGRLGVEISNWLVEDGVDPEKDKVIILIWW